jgi:hypothetical protein
MQYAEKELELWISAASVSVVKFSVAAVLFAFISSAHPVPLHVGGHH